MPSERKVIVSAGHFVNLWVYRIDEEFDVNSYPRDWRVHVPIGDRSKAKEDKLANFVIIENYETWESDACGPWRQIRNGSDRYRRRTHILLLAARSLKREIPLLKRLLTKVEETNFQYEIKLLTAVIQGDKWILPDDHHDKEVYFSLSMHLYVQLASHLENIAKRTCQITGKTYMDGYGPSFGDNSLGSKFTTYGMYNRNDWEVLTCAFRCETESFLKFSLISGYDFKPPEDEPEEEAEVETEEEAETETAEIDKESGGADDVQKNPFVPGGFFTDTPRRVDPEVVELLTGKLSLEELKEKYPPSAPVSEKLPQPSSHVTFRETVESFDPTVTPSRSTNFPLQMSYSNPELTPNPFIVDPQTGSKVQDRSSPDERFEKSSRGGFEPNPHSVGYQNREQWIEEKTHGDLHRDEDLYADADQSNAYNDIFRPSRFEASRNTTRETTASNMEVGLDGFYYAKGQSRSSNRPNPLTEDYSNSNSGQRRTYTTSNTQAPGSGNSGVYRKTVQDDNGSQEDGNPPEGNRPSGGRRPSGNGSGPPGGNGSSGGPPNDPFGGGPPGGGGSPGGGRPYNGRNSNQGSSRRPGGVPGGGGDDPDPDPSGTSQWYDNYRRPSNKSVRIGDNKYALTSEIHFDTKLKPEAVPTWDGDDTKVGTWLLQINEIADRSYSLFVGLGDVVPTRFRDGALRWWLSLDQWDRVSSSTNWSTLKKKIQSYWMNQAWFTKMQSRALRMRYRETGNVHETPSEFFIRKREAIKLVYQFSDHQIMNEVLKSAPVIWGTVLQPVRIRHLSEFQSLLKYYENYLETLNQHYDHNSFRKREDRDSPQNRSRSYRVETSHKSSNSSFKRNDTEGSSGTHSSQPNKQESRKVYAVGYQYIKPQFPPDDKNVSKRRTPESYGARGCIYCGSKKHWDKECKHSDQGKKKVRTFFVHLPQDTLRSEADYEDAYQASVESDESGERASVAVQYVDAKEEPEYEDVESLGYESDF